MGTLSGEERLVRARCDGAVMTYRGVSFAAAQL